ncbi:MAG: multidrug efflux SMR transporter [candidate division KSB1 bacterium]|nr:multidrug efflux SMR transporter [candidate division KSB1 bacterium]MDZ7276170.1 multidrug efflux SMR transporter [candidate division KSB1 bacterium]MDZ7287050.1 multidrug efflux SMR transporter [candidate division KSB1 bacterium]MDZ7297025.1 multidrug efflux SMR transporter [candidate division KSB1 bacterium]MDZ7307532.1 multidrug efflux SMR transporter [candidate division KSB1 bacterium]
MPWLYLLLASLLEIGWVISLKFTDGFTRVWPVVCYAVFGFGSAYFLSLAIRALPMGTAYAIWMGIAIVGAAVFGILHLREPAGWFRLLCIGLILFGIVGLKFADRKPAGRPPLPKDELAHKER